MRTFRSLRHRNYRLYFIGQLVSLIGSWTQTTALMWIAHQKTDTSQWPAFLVAVQIGPTFLFGPWGGALADRVPKRRLIFLTQSFFLTAAVILLGLYHLDALSLWVMLGVMFFHGCVQAIDLPARLAFVPGLVPREDLINAVALNSLLFNAARAIGPAIAGFLLHASGPGLCFLVNAVSYLAVLWALWLMRLPPAEETVPARTPGGAFGVLNRERGLLALVLVAGLVAIGGWPLLALLPSFASKVLGRGEDGYSMLLSSVGAGALVAALTAATFGSEKRRRRLLFAGLVLVAIALAGLAAATEPIGSMAACMLFGFGMILFFATGQSAVQLSVANQDRGKVMGVWAMMLSAGVPMGNLVFGPAADVFGLTAVLLTQAVIVLSAASIILVGRVR